MEKPRAISDTCCIERISAEGKKPDYIKKILDEIDYQFVIHPYVLKYEYELHDYLKALLNEGYIICIEYDEFLKDEASRQLYEYQFESIYIELRSYLIAVGGIKQMPELKVPPSHTIYDWHIAGSSMGDVHMILMASFLKLAVFLTEDSDIGLLRDITHRRFSLGKYHLEIKNAVDILKEIAGKEGIQISHKELENIVKSIGKRHNWAEINQVWHDAHDW